MVLKVTARKNLGGFLFFPSLKEVGPCTREAHGGCCWSRSNYFYFLGRQGSRAGGWSGVAGEPQTARDFFLSATAGNVLPFAIRAAAAVPGSRAVVKREKRMTPSQFFPSPWLTPPPKGKVHNVNIWCGWYTLNSVFSTSIISLTL